MTSVVLFDAYAKLTLSLRVTGTRPDGFHELDALVVSVSTPHDGLTLSRRDDAGVACRVTGEAAAGVPSDHRNLAVRGIELLLPAGAGVDLFLEKRIPSGAGLGGGSADAATALAGTAALFELDLGEEELLAAAAALGSDVPFCVAGGAAWMRGRGEILDPLPTPASFPVVIAVPPFACSTPAVYRAWDELGGPRATRAVPAPAAVAGVLGELTNDLEPAAEVVAPQLADFRDAVETVAGAPALLAGSGSAYAVCFDDLHRAEHIAAMARAALPNAAVFLGTTTATGSRRLP